MNRIEADRSPCVSGIFASRGVNAVIKTLSVIKEGGWIARDCLVVRGTVNWRTLVSFSSGKDTSMCEDRYSKSVRAK